MRTPWACYLHLCKCLHSNLFIKSLNIDEFCWKFIDSAMCNVLPLFFEQEKKKKENQKTITSSSFPLQKVFFYCLEIRHVIIIIVLSI